MSSLTKVMHISFSNGNVSVFRVASRIASSIIYASR